jgi:hypothetical protein
MLQYHPALDPYHAAFRMLRLLTFDAKAEYEREKLFILDFYVAFPHLIADIRLPPAETRRKRAFARYANEYVFTGTPKVVFLQMRLLQETALRMLFSKGLVDEALYHDGIIRLQAAVELPPELAERVAEENTRDGEPVRYLVEVVGGFSLYGAGGLKDRTGLMEFRYDAA